MTRAVAEIFADCVSDNILILCATALLVTELIVLAPVIRRDALLRMQRRTNAQPTPIGGASVRK